MDKLLDKIITWINSVTEWSTFEGWMAKIAIFFIAFGLILWSIKFALESLSKIAKSWKSLGLPTTLSPDLKLLIAKRKQFCKVIRSDIETLNKVENWNDQFFTDLEAEVEAEGVYYSSIFSRIFDIRSEGLRRTSSLITAIESSVEQSLLLVGDPGSGKSVALRHLALQIAEQGITSSDSMQKVPLYINLKEMPPKMDKTLDADCIKSFVVDNARRGDADTAEFIRSNWNDFKEKGIWFFLFDSFDEIPDVMHAATGSSIIKDYSDALRLFLSGMPNCRGIVASREYKGPNSLPWKKFRIMPLSSSKQRSLIDNALLSPTHRGVLQQHLALHQTNLRSSPMFLTLLCKFIKQNGVPPINDHHIVDEHLRYLANRDSDYILRKYGSTSNELLEDATKLAVLFAENDSLSLSPTTNEIRRFWCNSTRDSSLLETVIHALVDIKIGRSDVREATTGERRFTFSHRRYQETLYVNHLASATNPLNIDSLLCNMKWREYAVTFLQTQPLDKLLQMLRRAQVLLSEWNKRITYKPIMPDFKTDLSYCTWSDKDATRLLELLSDGLTSRKAELPSDILLSIKSYLMPIWEKGDWYDKCRVLELSSLLPDHELIILIRTAIREGDSTIYKIAFDRIRGLSSIDDEMADWIARYASRQILGSNTSEQIARVEAICARLPESLNMHYVVNRAKSLRSLTSPFLLRFIRGNVLDGLRGIFYSSSRGAFMLLLILQNMFLLILASYVTFSASSTQESAAIVYGYTLFLTIVGIPILSTCAILYLNRSYRHSISISSIFGVSKPTVSVQPMAKGTTLIAYAAIALVVVICTLITCLHLVDYLDIRIFISGASLVFAIFSSLHAFSYALDMFHQRRIKRLVNRLPRDNKTVIRLLNYNLRDIYYIVDIMKELVLPAEYQARSLSRILVLPPSQYNKRLNALLFSHSSAMYGDFKRQIQEAIFRCYIVDGKRKEGDVE